MARVIDVNYSFDARWGSDVRVHGIDTIPRIVTAHQGALGLSYGEFALVVQVFSFKWSKDQPRPTARMLAKRMGTTRGTVHQLAHSLKEKGYLVRRCVDAQRGVWEWDFTPLIKKALELEEQDHQVQADREAARQVENRGIGQPIGVGVGQRQGNAVPVRQGGVSEPQGGGLGQAKPLQEEQYVPRTTYRARYVPSDSSTPLEPVLNPEPDDIVVVDSPQVKEQAQKLINLGMDPRVAILLTGKFETSRVEEVTGYVRSHIGDIHSPAGFAKCALEEDWNLGQPCPQCQGSGKARINGVGGYACEYCHGTGRIGGRPSRGFTAPGPGYSPPPNLWKGYDDPPLTNEDRVAGLGHIREALGVVEQAGWTRRI
jgi:hypothetical protein